MKEKSDGSDKNISMADIAEELGVSLMTVSMALRDHHRISEKTKIRVKETAERLGYRKDPELSRLMSYIRHRKTVKHQANLAFIHYYGNQFHSLGGIYIKELYKGAKERAEHLGYSLERIDISTKGMTKRRMHQICDTRNIQGLMLCPLIRGVTLPFRINDRLPVELLPGVSFAYSIEDPKYSRIATNHYQCVVLAMEKLHAAGFQRIGMAMDEAASEKVRDIWIAGYIAWQLRHFGKIRIEPLLVRKDWTGELFAWMNEQRPDVLLSQNMSVRGILQRGGYRIPEDMGLAYLNANLSGDPEAGGIYQDLVTQGQLAVDHLVSQILARQKGIPKSNVTIMVKGQWRPGKTIGSPRQSTTRSRS